MVTALTLYATNTNATTLTTARTLVITQASPSTNTFGSLLGTATGYGEVFAQTTGTAWQALGSIGAASGNGFILETSALDLNGQQIVAGTWTPKYRGKVSVGTATIDIYCRAFSYNSGVYTPLWTQSLTGQAFTTVSTTFTFAGASESAYNFHSGDHLYFDYWLNVTANNTGSGAATVSIVESLSTSVASSGTLVATTPGYQTIPRATTTFYQSARRDDTSRGR